MPRTCVCRTGPWSDHGVCDHCGGTNPSVPTLFTGPEPRTVTFLTDDEISARLRVIADALRIASEHARSLIDALA